MQVEIVGQVVRLGREPGELEPVAGLSLGGGAIERVAELEPGLFEVEVAVAWKPFAATATVSRSLVTRIARQVKR